MSASNKSGSKPSTKKKAFVIKALGVGGAGCNAVAHMARQGIEGVEFLALNTDAAGLGGTEIETKLVLGLKLTRGLGAGGDPERGRLAAEEDIEAIRSLCDGADVLFIIAGFGGGTGTGASPVIARVAKEAGALVLATVMLPFEWEGSRRSRQAYLGLSALKAAADAVICVPNQKVSKMVDQNTTLLDTFAITNELLAQSLRAVSRLLARPGLINVDFADLCAVTRGLHGNSSLATAEASGENRSREVVQKLIAHPLLDGGQVLNQSAAVLVSLVGGPDLTMAEVHRVMEQINRQCENAHIIMGAAIEPDCADKLALTVVASGSTGQQGESSLELAPQELEWVSPSATPRPASRFIAPAPDQTLENTEKLLKANGSRNGKNKPALRQGQLNLEIVARGRFEQSEPTIHQGQDLDIPTYVRRGIALN